MIIPVPISTEASLNPALHPAEQQRNAECFRLGGLGFGVKLYRGAWGYRREVSQQQQKLVQTNPKHHPTAVLGAV